MAPRSLLRCLALAAMSALSACTETVTMAPADAAAPDDAPPILTLPSPLRTCTSPDEIAVRTGTSVEGIECVDLSPRALPDDDGWPDATGATEPIVYVDPNADGGGDGTRARPFQTLAQAWAATPVPSTTVMLRRGLHRVAAGSLGGTIRSVRGVGCGRTVIWLPRGEPGFQLRRAGEYEIRGVEFTYDPATTPTDADLPVVVEFTALRMNDVCIDGGTIALSSSSGGVRMERVRITNSRTADYAVIRGRATMIDCVFRDGGGEGLRAREASFTMRRVRIASHARQGVIFGRSIDGWARCDGSSDSGTRSCLDTVEVADNGLAGLQVQSSSVAEMRRLYVHGTRLVTLPRGAAGDGLVVNGATVELDADITDPAQRGFASAFVNNGRAGVLVQGGGSRLSLRGALIDSNGAGGVFVSTGGTLDLLGESLLVRNAIGGLVVTPGAQAGIVQCNGIAETVRGTVNTTSGPITLGDAMHLNGSLGDLTVRDNVVERNAGFGLLANDATATLEGNRGANNRYGVATYAGAVVTGNVGSIRGRESPPDAPPALAEALQ